MIHVLLSAFLLPAAATGGQALPPAPPVPLSRPVLALGSPPKDAPWVRGFWRWLMPQCRFGDGEAVGRFRLSEGYVAYPDDREQDLCWHHSKRVTPLGTFEVIEDYTLPGSLRLLDLLAM